MEATKLPPYLVHSSRNEPILEEASAGIYPYLHVLRNRKKILIVSLLFTLSVACFVNLTQKPVYESSAELVMQPRDSKAPTSPGGVVSYSMQDPTFFLTQFRIIRGPHLAEKIVLRLEKQHAVHREGLLANFRLRRNRKKNDTGVFSETERRALRSSIQRSLSVRQVERGARLIEIASIGHLPEMVSLVANAAAETYVETNYASHLEAFRQSFLMISKSLAEVREKIKTGEAAFQKIDSEIRLLEALKIYGDRHPLVVQLRSEIPGLAEKLKRGIRNLETMEVSQQQGLVPLLTVPATEIAELKKIEADLYTLRPILEQELNTNREMYNSIFRKLQEVEVTGGGDTWMEAKVVEPASSPSKPVRPNKRMNVLLGLLMGIVIGTGLAFFLEYLDSSLRSPEDIRYYLKLFPFGTIPQVTAPQNENELEPSEIVEDSLETVPARSQRSFWTTSDPKIPLYVSEAYRIVRTNLSYGQTDRPLRVIQVTSAVKGEGKTTTVVNLGISFAQAGIKTVLVDADMRRPSLHRILKLQSAGGLSQALNNGVSWNSLVQPTGIENLYCLTAGMVPLNPAELLASKRMDALLRDIREDFEMVILDCPPILSVADCPIIAPRVDGTILVSRAGYIPRHICLHAKNAIELVKGRVIGSVLNGVQSHHQSYYYSYATSSYYYGGGEEADQKKSEGFQSEFPALDKLKALREPLLAILAEGWKRSLHFLKRDPSTSHKKSVDAAP